MVDQAMVSRVPARFALRFSAVLAIAAAGALPGCGSSGETSLVAPPGRALAPEDFRGASTARPLGEGSTRVRVVSAEQASRGDVVGDAQTDPAEAPTAPIDRAAPGVQSLEGTALVDAKVGDLNGAPIFASEWLEPISGRLRAEARQRELPEWRSFTANLIRDRLAAQLKDELLYAEIQAELTPEEKAGVRQIINQAQREQIRRTGGSRTLAGQQLQEANDQTIDSFLRDRERQILIQEKYRREIESKIQVSQRDIELFYERNFEEFNPPPLATIMRIRVRGSDAEAIAEVTRRLGAGEPFEEVAQLEANNVSEVLTEREIEGPFEEFEFYGVESLNEAARSLTVGAVAGPIEHGSSVSWLRLASLEDRTVTLYDAQLAIENQLRADQQRDLEQRYIFKLIRRAGLAEFDQIVANLTDVAERWYYTGPPADRTEARAN